MMDNQTAVNGDGLTFDAWMAAVDKAIARVCGLSALDLADYHYWDAWSDGCDPTEVAEEVLEEEGFPFAD